jgi:nucleotidyltransferase substrate binding protein (TIGR01987 family)
MSLEENAPYLEPFESALARFQEALSQPKSEWIRDASIQRFEFTIELAWKAIMRFARREGIECASPRQAFRAAFKLGWVEDDDVWLDMLEDRNLTSHTYNVGVAEKLYARLPAYQAALSQLLERLRQLPQPPKPEAEQ